MNVCGKEGISITENRIADALDKILIVICGAAYIVPEFAQTYGLDRRLVWVPAICYSIWIVFAGVIKPRISLSDSFERSTIERMRGSSYVATLPFALILNAILIQYSLNPYAFLICGMILPAVGLLLAAADVAVGRGFFMKEINCMDNAQKYSIMQLFRESGAASIWISWSLLLLNFEFLVPKDLTVLGAILTLFGALIMLSYSYYRNRNSSKIARDLSELLTNSRWRKRYIATSSKKKRPKRA